VCVRIFCTTYVNPSLLSWKCTAIQWFDEGACSGRVSRHVETDAAPHRSVARCRPPAARRRPLRNEVIIRVSRRLGLSLVMAPMLLSGCMSVSIPSQSDPSCSWSSQPPGNADSLCVSTFHTLRSVLNAAIQGDGATLRRFVPNPTIRHRIADFGTTVRHKGNISVHVTPSFTLGITPNGDLGAEFNIVGSTHHGDVKAPQTVYLAARGGSAVIVHDQPMQEW
jgi:hypothetical protein